MKLTLFSSLLAYAILATSPVAADFYIYRMWQIFYIDHYQTYSEEYGFFPGPPDCNDVNDRWHEQHANKDVSGSKHGGPQDSFDAEIIEFNNDIGHYTYYKDSGGELRDTNDNAVGHCHTDASDSVNGCWNPRDDIHESGAWHGNSLVYCETAITSCKVFWAPTLIHSARVPRADDAQALGPADA
ncbi:hypothetical protein LA080_000659 [Diaporthe eres]|nr:hypothetical protein LA080_000659 [Diaporthe eres]